MLGTKRLLIDVEILAIERLGFHVFPLQMVERGNVANARCSLRMIRAEGLFIDVESPLKKRLSLGIPRALLQVKACSIHQPGCCGETESIFINVWRQQLRVWSQAVEQWPGGIFEMGKGSTHRADNALRPHTS